MRFNDNEYIVSKNVPDESITIVKEALEKWRDHYLKVASEYKNEPRKWAFFVGKANVLIDLIKHFEEEGV